MRGTISGVMVVLNEEAIVRQALESVQWMDQVVVVDAYSHFPIPVFARRFRSKFAPPWLGNMIFCIFHMIHVFE